MDIKTIIIGLFLINLYLGIFTFLIKLSQPCFKYFGYWTVANLLIAFGHLFIVFRSEIPDFISIVIANSLFVIAGLVRIYGFKKLFNIPFQNKIIYIWGIGFLIFWTLLLDIFSLLDFL